MEPLELAVFSKAGLSVVPLAPGRDLVVGRAETSDVLIDDESVSRRHAIVRTGPPLEIEDVSANGTFLSRAAPSSSREPRAQTADSNRVRVTRAELAAGDTIHLGGAMLVVRKARTAAAPPSAGPDGFDAIVRSPALARVYEEARAPRSSRSRCSSSARPGSEKTCSRATCTTPRRARRGRSSRSTAPRSARRSPRASSSDTRRERSPARSRPARGSSSPRAEARCSSTRSASCRCLRRRSSARSRAPR